MNNEHISFFNEVVLKYNGNDCLLWPYRSRRGIARGDHPQPSIVIDGKTHTVARLVCKHFHGEPFKDAVVCHHPIDCNNPNCVSWKHLRWGTRSENERDKIKAGTWSRGITKLSKLDVWEIHRLADAGMKHSQIAETINKCGRPHITDIVNGRRHRDVYLAKQQEN